MNLAETVSKLFRRPSRHALKRIVFEDQLLPDWAQLLDLAACLSPVAEETRSWFSRFTRQGGVEDSGTVKDRCTGLLVALQNNRETWLSELRRHSDDGEAEKVLAAWHYSLTTMVQVAEGTKVCHWQVGDAVLNLSEDADWNRDAGGEIELRRPE